VLTESKYRINVDSESVGIVVKKMKQKQNGVQTKMVTRGMINVNGLNLNDDDDDFTSNKIDLRQSMAKKKKQGGCCGGKK